MKKKPTTHPRWHDPQFWTFIYAIALFDEPSADPDIRIEVG